MLAKMNPLVDKWYFSDLPTPRAASGAALLAQWQAQNSRRDATGEAHTSPAAALRRCRSRGRPG
jgi:dihydrofolate synthase/folylpolyglutamate synthase